MVMSKVTYGIDWVSATSQDEGVGYNWYAEYAKFRDGNFPLFSKAMGMQGGYLGEETEGFCWAYSKSLKSYFVKGSGVTAEVVYPIAYGCDRYTRIDLRVDVALTDADVDVAKRAFELNADRKRPKYKLITGAGGLGQTLYVGSLASDMFGRLYDKSAERLEIAGYTWRYEIVVRKPHADGLVDKLNSDGLGAIPRIVHSWFADRDVMPIFPVDAISRLKRAEKGKTTVEQKLEWLRKSVQPTVSKLVQSGLAQECFEALGISKHRI
jgi:hypothetical protein